MIKKYLQFIKENLNINDNTFREYSDSLYDFKISYIIGYDQNHIEKSNVDDYFAVEYNSKNTHYTFLDDNITQLVSIIIGGPTDDAISYNINNVINYIDSIKDIINTENKLFNIPIKENFYLVKYDDIIDINIKDIVYHVDKNKGSFKMKNHDAIYDSILVNFKYDTIPNPYRKEVLEKIKVYYDNGYFFNIKAKDIADILIDSNYADVVSNTTSNLKLYSDNDHFFNHKDLFELLTSDQIEKIRNYLINSYNEDIDNYEILYSDEYADIYFKCQEKIINYNLQYLKKKLIFEFDKIIKDEFGNLDKFEDKDGNFIYKIKYDSKYTIDIANTSHDPYIKMNIFDSMDYYVSDFMYIEPNYFDNIVRDNLNVNSLSNSEIDLIINDILKS